MRLTVEQQGFRSVWHQGQRSMRQMHQIVGRDSLEHGTTCRRTTAPELTAMEEGTNERRWPSRLPRLCERETLMDELHKLIEKKSMRAFSVNGMRSFWRHVEARIDGSPGR